MFRVTTEIPRFTARFETGRAVTGWVRGETREKAKRGRILNFAENTGIPT
jgi:hypothetical protein